MPAHTSDDIEAIKNNIRLIRRSGAHTEIFGWILLAVGAGGLWLFNARSYALIWLIAFSVVGLFFFISGRYIRGGFGRRTKLALLANSIVAFPLSFAVLPIYICVQASNNYTRYKDLPDKIQQLFNKPRWPRLGIIDAIALIVVVLLGAVSLTFKFGQLNAATRQAAIAAIKPVPKVDTAGRSHFTINFPGSVVISDFTEQVSGHTVTYSTYSSTAGKDKGDFKVYAYYSSEPSFKYSSMQPAALTSAVHKSLTNLVKDMHGTISSSTPATFAGSPSEEAEFTDQTFAGTNTGYIRVFFMQDYEYAVIAIGSGRPAFNDYADSFRFTGL
jgi:hypothetical protein